MTTVLGATSLEDCVKVWCRLMHLTTAWASVFSAREASTAQLPAMTRRIAHPATPGPILYNMGQIQQTTVKRANPVHFQSRDSSANLVQLAGTKRKNPKARAINAHRVRFSTRRAPRTCRIVQPCPLGSYAPNLGNTECLLCDAGTYNDETGQGSCALCPRGTALSATGSRSLDDCLECAEGIHGAERGELRVPAMCTRHVF